MADVFRSPLLSPRGVRPATPSASIFPNLAVGLVVAASAPFVNPPLEGPQAKRFLGEPFVSGAITLEDDPLILPFFTLQIRAPEPKRATAFDLPRNRVLLEVVGPAPFFGVTGPGPFRRQIGFAAQTQSRLVLETPVFDPFIPVLFPTIPRRQHFSTAFPLNLQPTFALAPVLPPPGAQPFQAVADFRAHWVFASPSFAAVWRIPAAATLAVSFADIESWIELRPKTYGVAKSYTVDFISRLAAGVTIVDTAVASITWSGVDADGDAIVAVTPTYSGTKVTFNVTSGLTGVLYAVGIAVEGSDGSLEQITGLVAVIAA